MFAKCSFASVLSFFLVHEEVKWKAADEIGKKDSLNSFSNFFFVSDYSRFADFLMKSI